MKLDISLDSNNFSIFNRKCQNPNCGHEKSEHGIHSKTGVVDSLLIDTAILPCSVCDCTNYEIINMNSLVLDYPQIDMSKINSALKYGINNNNTSELEQQIDGLEKELSKSRQYNKKLEKKVKTKDKKITLLQHKIGELLLDLEISNAVKRNLKNIIDK